MTYNVDVGTSMAMRTVGQRGKQNAAFEGKKLRLRCFVLFCYLLAHTPP